MTTIYRWIGLAVLVAVLLGGPAFAASATLTWTDNSTNETGFDIERKTEACTGSGPFTPIATVGMNVTTYKDLTVVEGVTYCYRVDAYNPAGKSPYSNTAGLTIPFTVPVPPTGLGVASP